MSTGVGSGKSFVMQQSRCGGSVGGCEWLVVCVLMMSAWDDGDAGTFDLASDFVAAGGVAGGLSRKGDDAEEIGGPTRKGDDDLASDLIAAGGVAGGLTRKGDDAEEIGGAVFGFGAAVGRTWSAVSDNGEGTCM